MGDILNWFNTIFGGVVGGLTGAPSAATNWIANLGGQLASGVEAGFLALFKDIWNVLLPPLEIMAGASIVVIALFIAFQDQVASLAPIGLALAVA